MALNFLIVDDSSVMRAMLIKTMCMAGLQPTSAYQAENGLEGLRILKHSRIDLVLLDIHMPVMTGEEMLACMKADPDLKDIPVIVISTEGNRTRIDRLQRQDLTRFIHKPFSAEHIRDVVKSLLAQAAPPHQPRPIQRKPQCLKI